VALGAVGLVALLLAFGLGLLAGRQWTASAPAQAAMEPARKPAPAPRRSGLTEPMPDLPAAQEKLTFYQTLTAPLGAQPASSPVDLTAKPEAARAEPPRSATAAPRADRLQAAVPPPAARGDRPAAPDRPTAARAAADEPRGDWVVQVGAFRERGQAEGVRRGLAGAGFDAYVLAAPDGTDIRYKVRLGSFRTREEAARVAQRVRQERSLSAFVTSR
jgi:cell division protein FtsN